MHHPIVRVAETSEVEQLYREHRDHLWRSLYLFAGDREIATDAVAEAFAQALRRGPAVRAVLPWVWRAAFRIAAGELQRRRTLETKGADRSYEIASDPSLMEALKRLSQKEREAVVLRYYGDRSLHEIASTMGSTVPAVGMLLTRARRRLRTLLEDDDD
jgi:RNA polymerase sigma factor (sigma-70 family)